MIVRALTGLLAVALTACGSVEDNDAVAVAAGDTVSAGSARTEQITMTTFDGEAVEIRSSGIVDYRRDRSRFVTDYPAIDGEPAGRLETITIGEISYTQLASGGGRMPPGKRWVRFDPSAPAEPVAQKDDEGTGSAVVMSFSDDSLGRDPGEIVEHLAKAGSDIVHVGRDRVRGVETIHYRTTLDLRQTFLDDARKAGIPAEHVEEMLEHVDTTRRVDVWVGADDLVRRIVTRSSLGGGSTMTTIEFFDFGVDEEIEAPPAVEVADWSEVEPEFDVEEDIEAELELELFEDDE
jgi:hypothetical protein